MPYTPRVKKVLALAGKEAKSLNHSYVGTEHILLGLLREGEGVAARVLKSLDVDVERCRNEILSELDPNFLQAKNQKLQWLEVVLVMKKAKIKRHLHSKHLAEILLKLQKKERWIRLLGVRMKSEELLKFCVGGLKNNPVLIGEAGVGKTAIVEGLAQQIASGMVPENLLDKKVVTLDLALMVAGTKYRGQFEERIKAVMDELKRLKTLSYLLMKCIQLLELVQQKERWMHQIFSNPL